MNLSLATLGGAVMGVVAGAGLALMPTPMLEGLVMDSGIPAIVAAAQPPLGMTARLAIAGGIGAVVALIGWFAMFLMFGTRGLTIGKAETVVSEVPVIRRADAHPDAPPRPPLRATRDLGVPFLDVTAENPAPIAAPVPSDVAEPAPLFAEEPVVAEAPAAKLFAPKHVVAQIEEKDLPVDLDQPLSAFDPTAIPATPAAPTPTVASLRRPLRPSVFEEGERFETFELTPMRRESVPVPPPGLAPRPRVREEAIVRPETDATIHALLDRLEKGVVRRGLAQPAPAEHPRSAERGLEDALVTLRNLARRA